MAKLDARVALTFKGLTPLRRPLAPQLAADVFFPEEPRLRPALGFLVPGFAGGAKNTAHYETVSDGRTGHAESVQITFDPRVVSYGEILRVYFSVAHDPTELNRQGPDSGTSYRSEIFFASPTQEKVAKAYVAQLGAAHVFGDAIVTKIEKLNGFYAAEGYHQDYLIHNPTAPYIVYNDLPKIDALKRVFPTMYRDKPVMLASIP